MSNFAKKLAEQLINGIAGIDTENLYINVDLTGTDSIMIEYRYKDKKTAITGFHSSVQKGEKGDLVTGDLEAQLASSNEEAKGPCLNAYIIKNVAVRPQGGWGRLLYYIAMHFSGEHGITADREKSSSSAVGAWNNLYADSEVQKLPLDNVFDPITAPKDDDCNLASSGIYGYEKSKDSYQWNPMLSYGDERNVDIENIAPEEERLKKGDEYRKIKASKLNYVYKGRFPEVIGMLQQANKLVVNGKINESIRLFNLIFG